jgi:YfiH family protein
MTNSSFLIPDWSAPSTVKACISLRHHTLGHSSPPFQTFNLANHVGDDPAQVKKNRALFREYVPADPHWLKQTHSDTLINLDDVLNKKESNADAAFTTTRKKICAVMTADCLGILLCNRKGTLVAAIHAGWRGIVNQIIAKSIQQLPCKPHDLLATIGPAIGPKYFEIQEDVKKQLDSSIPDVKSAFHSYKPGYFLANLFTLAKKQLHFSGVNDIFCDEQCTYSDPEKYFSYRRDGDTGRIAHCIWIE